MSKPLGMTTMFQVISPTRIEDAFYKAVEMAIDAGWTPEQAIREVRHDWGIYLAEKAQLDEAEFQRLTK